MRLTMAAVIHRYDSKDLFKDVQQLTLTTAMILYQAAVFLLMLAAAFSSTSGFVPPPALVTRLARSSLASTRNDFEFSFEVPKKGIADIGTAEVKLPPLLDESELIVVRYDLPFGLNAEPSSSRDGEVVVTKDGAAGKEKVGDILRQTTFWGGIGGKEVGIFDVSKNKGDFDKVVQALVTNDLAVSDEIVLVFERPL